MKIVHCVEQFYDFRRKLQKNSFRRLLVNEINIKKIEKQKI